MESWIQSVMTWYSGISTTEFIWLTVGFTGQAIFGTRFLIQWIASEREGRSVVPTIFWYQSILGSLIVLSYAIYRVDPVFIVSQAGGTMIYLRNLMLIHKNPDDSLNPAM